MLRQCWFLCTGIAFAVVVLLCGTQVASSQLVSDFEGAAAPVDAGWTADENFTIVADPGGGSNNVLAVGSTEGNSNGYTGISIPEGTTSTLFYRMRRSGTINVGSGASNFAAPNTWGDFEGYLVSTDDISVRDDDTALVLTPMTEDVWYNAWLVLDNAAETYEVYLQGGIFDTQTKMSDADSSHSVFDFRSDTEEIQDILSFFARTSSQTGTLYLDDIYVTAGESLTNPAIPDLDGDFNMDGDVDGGDFLALQRGFGTTYTGTDFDNWEAEYGTGVGAVSGVSAVPEPSAIALLMLGAIAMGSLRTTSRRS